VVDDEQDFLETLVESADKRDIDTTRCSQRLKKALEIHGKS